jgi:Arc/MetJ family transcription regulator
MRTNIEIDDELMEQAMALGPKTTMKAVVEEALILAVKLAKQAEIKNLWGIGWDGDLDAMRQSRFTAWDETGMQTPESREFVERPMDTKIPAA